MLNRRHIRIKVMQSLYAFYCSDGNLSQNEVEKGLNANINRLYELYLYIILFTKELISFAEFYDDEVKSRIFPSAKERNFNARFYLNPVASVLLNSGLIVKTLESNKILWNSEDNDLLRKIFFDLKSSETYQDYIHSDETQGIDNTEIYSFILKQYPENFALLEQHFEEKFINWYDDYKIAIQMAIKTFRQIQSDPEGVDFILPLLKEEEDTGDFAINLFRSVILNGELLDQLITTKIDKWEPSRVALIDILILKIGVTEFLFFPNIPVKVTINESIELAKNYSSPNSRKFINGVLDNILIDLKSKDKIKKSGMGLVNE